jgi:predicted DNA-binding ribbon-helix-helix protein
MPRSTLVNRNIVAERGRTSMRLEPELWDALAEICRRERTSPSELCRRLERSGLPGGRTSAMRVFIVQYLRAAATEEGHAAAGHGAQDAAARPAMGRAPPEVRPALAAYGAD